MNSQSLYYSIPLSITFTAPVMIQGAGSKAFGLDSALQRAPDDDTPIIPGSLIRGNLRHAWHVFSKLDPSNFPADTINNWLGKKSESKGGDGYQAHIAALNFDYWWRCTTSESADKQAQGYRVEINNDTGVSERGSLQIIESPWKINSEVTFTGEIKAWLRTDQLDKLTNWLNRGMAWANQMGAFKGVGYGTIKKFEVGNISPIIPPNLPDWRKYTQSQNTDCIGVCLTFDRPICFAKPNTGSNNRFVANDVVFGSALIATIAQQAKALSLEPLLKHLNQIYISHAYPVSKPTTNQHQWQMPMAIPLSLAKKNSGYQDISQQPWDDKESLNFSSNWKMEIFKDIEQKLGRTSPTRRLEVRTAINETTLAAKHESLFSMETCLTHQHNWLAKIDLGQVDTTDKEAVKSQLTKVLTYGLYPLGKTKARASIQLIPVPQYKITSAMPAIHSNAGDQRQVRIYLQSDTRLLHDSFVRQISNAQQTLHQAYAEVWENWSNNALSLTSFFAQQSLLGGNYWWHRFAKQTTDKHYHPELITKAGSVFVLNYQKEDTQDVNICLERWQRYGLPQPEQRLDNESSPPNKENWQHNPWIAQNGFGAIAINLDCTNLGG